MVKFKIRIERRPDAPPLGAGDFLSEAVVVVLLTAVVSLTALVVGFYIAGYR